MKDTSRPRIWRCPYCTRQFFEKPAAVGHIHEKHLKNLKGDPHGIGSECVGARSATLSYRMVGTSPAFI